MRARHTRPPLWFGLLVAGVVGLLCRYYLPPIAPAGAAADHVPPVQLAFWGFILGIIGWIWNGLQAAGAVTLEALAWAVKILQSGAATMANAIKDGADLLRRGFVAAWNFLGTLYDDVLKPAWEKFWSWFDKAKQWLDDTFAPVLKWIQDLRQTLLDWWTTYVRPWLDLIDVTRKIAHVLGSLGLAWARQLDATLADLEQKIEAPFRFLLGKINEVINVVNLIAGADGLLQRVALIRSLARDYQYAWSAIVAPYSHAIDDATRQTLKDQHATRTVKQVEADWQQFLHDDTGPLADPIRATAAAFRAAPGGP